MCVGGQSQKVRPVRLLFIYGTPTKSQNANKTWLEMPHCMLRLGFGVEHGNTPLFNLVLEYFLDDE